MKKHIVDLLQKVFITILKTVKEGSITAKVSMKSCDVSASLSEATLETMMLLEYAKLETDRSQMLFRGAVMDNNHKEFTVSIKKDRNGNITIGGEHHPEDAVINAVLSKV